VLLRTRAGRTTAAAVGALALTTTTLAATASPALAGPGKAPEKARSAPDKARPVSLFPTNDLTVRDASQLTGLRVDLPTEDCGNVIRCGLVERLNELDGFDLDPRLAIRYDSPVTDIAAAAARITLRAKGSGRKIGVDRVVWDPATTTLYAHPAEQLAPSTTYRLKVQGGPRSGAAHEDFTTLSATDGLLDLRRQLDSGAAFQAAGIADRDLRVEGVFPAADTSITWRQDLGTGVNAVPVALPAAGTGATYVFGSYLAPSWLGDDVEIEQTPTRDAGPAAVGAERLPFVAVLPAGETPAGGWPVAVFGHGFTASTTSVFLAAATNARAGIATIGTLVVGHGFGEDSTWEITSGGTTTSIPTYGRGVDQGDPGDGIGSTEGSSATGEAAAIGSRDTLRQTATDISTLIRAVGGTDVDGDGDGDLRGSGVTYFGQSFGGIYGTMLTGADPQVTRSVLNVPGGPIAEIARISPSFRLLTTRALQAQGLLNSGDATRAFFQEQLPLRGEGPVTATAPGAIAIQDYLALTTWLTRPGSPETFAPLIAPERVLVQVAFGDRTVPNPTSYTLIDAGDLFSRTSLYRHDKTPLAGSNPHSFLLQLAGPTAPYALQAQAQVAAFLGRGQVIDPDGAGPVWEVPIADPASLLQLNFDNPALRP